MEERNMAEVPVRESVGAALRFVRENIRLIGAVSALAALASALGSTLGVIVPALSMPTGVINSLVQAFAYAAFVGAALFGAGAVRGRWTSDGGRVWAAMIVVGFFLCIVGVVLVIPVSIALVAGPMAPYLSDLQAAGSNNDAVLAVMTRFAEENPAALLATFLFFVVIWLLLTSRLYLAAPATVDQQRILTFETWKWTKGAMLRIAGARLLLLIPANIFVGAIGYLIGRAFGIDTMNPATAAATVQANPLGFFIYVLLSSFITFALYSALEAGLSTYLYKGLRPRETQQP